MKAASRTQIASRVVAAVLGGYVLANLCAIALYHFLPASHAGSVEIALLTSFLFYAAAVMWVFAARTALRAWLGLAVPSAVCAIVIVIAP